MLTFGSLHFNQMQGAVGEVNGTEGIVLPGKCPPEI